MLKKLEPGQIVKILAKYLYEHIDSAYKIVTKANLSEVYMVVYYQIPQLSRKPTERRSYSELYEMTLQISITTYKDKIRINLTVMDPDKVTLSFRTYSTDMFYDLPLAKSLILKHIQEKLIRTFDEYEFVF